MSNYNYVSQWGRASQHDYATGSRVGDTETSEDKAQALQWYGNSTGNGNPQSRWRKGTMLRKHVALHISRALESPVGF